MIRAILFGIGIVISMNFFLFNVLVPKLQLPYRIGTKAPKVESLTEKEPKVELNVDESSKGKDQFTPPACKIRESAEKRRQAGDTVLLEYHKIIAIGDVHGSYSGLLEVMYEAGLVISPENCDWKPQGQPTLFVQMGDLVDRGPQAYEATLCLKKLQEEAGQFNAKVIRLFGNHEMWWLTGIFGKINKRYDTKEKVLNTIEVIINDIVSDKILGAYVFEAYDIPLIFVHAGFGTRYYEYLQEQLNTTVITANQTVEHTNTLLKQAVYDCGEFPCRDGFEHEVFEAGPDRGGTHIGGPFWTDFETIAQGNEDLTGFTDLVQIVGHTMAYCYNPARPGVHPAPDQAECKYGLIRPGPYMLTICVDGGMYIGARAFLEIDLLNGTFLSHQFNGIEDKWVVEDYTQQYCY